MKPKAVITALLLVFVLGSGILMIAKEARQDSGAERTATAAETYAAKAPNLHRKIRVYYFHGRARCPSCFKIETYTKETVQGDFVQALKDGSLEWQVVNVDEPANQHFVKDYQLYTKSVILADIREGKQTRWKNLEKVWELLHDKSAFRAYIQAEINAYLKGL